MTNTVLVGNMFFLLDIAFLIGTVSSAKKNNKRSAFLCGIITIVMMYLTFIVRLNA